MSRQIFTGAAIFDGTRLERRRALVVEAGRILSICAEDAAPRGEVVRLAGGVLAPGLLDLQVNGGGGVMLNEAPDLDGIRTICAAHAGLGTSGLLPTLITDTPDITRAAIAAGIAAAEAGVPGFLGLHLEGPHLDPRRKGAHEADLIRPMTEADLEALLDAAHRLPALMVTVAPESVSADQVAALAAAGVVVSLGHSDTDAAGANAAFRAGARAVTHLFNAMSPLGHRALGLVGAVLDSPDTYVGVIADGIHVAPEVLRIALKAKRGDDLMFLVTDAMAVAGTNLSEFRLRGRRIARCGGRLTLDDGTLAGADCDLPGCLRRLVVDLGVDASRALGMVTAVPAACIHMAGRRGCLLPGGVADLVHLDADWRLAGVWRRGGRIES